MGVTFVTSTVVAVSAQLQHRVVTWTLKTPSYFSMPGTVAVSRYEPGSSPEKRQNPPSLVRAVEVTFVSIFVTTPARHGSRPLDILHTQGGDRDAKLQNGFARHTTTS
jgi:hypothetical protein